MKNVIIIWLAFSGKWLLGMLTSNQEIIAIGCTILWIDVLVELGRPVNIFATILSRFLSSLTGNLLNMCHGKRGIVVRNNITASTVMAMFGAVPILKLMGLDDNLLKEGIGYMQIVGLFAFFQALSLTLSATLRASNKAVYPMIVVGLVNKMCQDL